MISFYFFQLRVDLAELSFLLGQAKRSHVVTILEAEIKRVSEEIQRRTLDEAKSEEIPKKTAQQVFRSKIDLYCTFWKVVI